MSLLHKALRSLNLSAGGNRANKNTKYQVPATILCGETLEPRAMFAVDTNDQISEAYNLGAMTVNRSRTGQAMDTAQDVDMYRFSVTAGQRIGFDVDRASGSLDSYLRVFDAAGNQLAFNDDGPTPGEAASSQAYVEVTFNTAGTFYVGVSGFGNQNYSAVTGSGDTNGSTGAYSLVLTRI